MCIRDRPTSAQCRAVLWMRCAVPVRPTFNDDHIIQIEEGRHPVVEKVIPEAVSYTHLAMIIIGVTLGAMNIKDVFNELRVYIYTIIKQLIFLSLIHI